MQSSLYREPYEKGLQDGEIKGEAKTLAKTAIKLLIKKFNIIPEDLKEEIQKLDVPTLEIIIDNILEYESIDQVKKHIQ